MLCMMKMLLKREAGGRALDSHGNFIFDPGKIMELYFDFLWIPYFYWSPFSESGLVLVPLHPSATLLRCLVCEICNSKSFHSFIVKLCLYTAVTGPCNTVGKMPDCRSRGREFDLGPVP